MSNGDLIDRKKISNRRENSMGYDTSLITPKISKLVSDEIRSYYNLFSVKDDKFDIMRERLNEHCDKGLSDDPEVRNSSDLKMLITHMSNLPAPTHNGCYYAIDLGGTNLRFFKIDLNQEKFRYSARRTEIPDEIKTGTKEQFFDYIASFIKSGFDHYKIPADKKVPYVGFTFSFPLEQTGLYSGNLVCWTKNFNIEGVVGEDIAKLTKEAAKKKGVNIGKLVLINDTTGTLFCGGLVDQVCSVGVIAGTGTNACYIESLSKVPKSNGIRTFTESIIINTEWGAFGNSGALDFIRNKYDFELDKNSENPGKQILEKMVSGMYLGEIARLVLIDMAKDKLIFKKEVPPKIYEKGSVKTYMLSEAYDLPKLKSAFLKELDVVVTGQELIDISHIFHKICCRSGKLVGHALVVLLKRVPKFVKTIAADGALFKNNPFYQKFVYRVIYEQMKRTTFTIRTVNDGSGKGAALAACVTEHQNTPRNPHHRRAEASSDD